MGNDWETNTNRYANEAGLYENLANVAVSQPISRDDRPARWLTTPSSRSDGPRLEPEQATGQVTETYTLAMGENGEPSRTLLSERFGGKIFVVPSTATATFWASGTARSRSRAS